jgi:hypothetical protein
VLLLTNSVGTSEEWGRRQGQGRQAVLLLTNTVGASVEWGGRQGKGRQTVLLTNKVRASVEWGGRQGQGRQTVLLTNSVGASVQWAVGSSALAAARWTFCLLALQQAPVVKPTRLAAHSPAHPLHTERCCRCMQHSFATAPRVCMSVLCVPCAPEV